MFELNQYHPSIFNTRSSGCRASSSFYLRIQVCCLRKDGSSSFTLANPKIKVLPCSVKVDVLIKLQLKETNVHSQTRPGRHRNSISLSSAWLILCFVIVIISGSYHTNSQPLWYIMEDWPKEEAKSSAFPNYHYNHSHVIYIIVRTNRYNIPFLVW